MLKASILFTIAVTLLFAVMKTYENEQSALAKVRAAKLTVPIAIKTKRRSEKDSSIQVTEIDYEFGTLRFTNAYWTDIWMHPKNTHAILYTFWPGFGDRSTFGDANIKDKIAIDFQISDKTIGWVHTNKYNELVQLISEDKARAIPPEQDLLEEYQIDRTAKIHHRYYMADFLRFEDQPLVIVCFLREIVKNYPEGPLSHKNCRFVIEIDEKLGVRVEFHPKHVKNIKTILPKAVALIEKIRNGTL